MASLPKSFPRSGKFGDLSVRRLHFTVEEGPIQSRQLVLAATTVDHHGFYKDEIAIPLILARDINKFLVEFTDPKTGEWVHRMDRYQSTSEGSADHCRLGTSGPIFDNRAQEAVVAIVALPALAVQPPGKRRATGTRRRLGGGDSRRAHQWRQAG